MYLYIWRVRYTFNNQAVYDWSADILDVPEDTHFVQMNIDESWDEKKETEQEKAVIEYVHKAYLYDCLVKSDLT